MVFVRASTEALMAVFVGAVSPWMLRSVPKCLLYVLSKSWNSPSCSNATLVSIVVATGQCRSKFQAKLEKGVEGGALYSVTVHFFDLRPSLTTRERSPALSM